MEKLTYLGILLTSEGKMEHEVDRQIGVASEVMYLALDRCGE